MLSNEYFPETPTYSRRWGEGVALGNRQWSIYPNMSKRLPLSLADCHTKGDFNRKSYYAQFEGNVEI